ncbi:MAG: 2-hydroxyacyl-CoA dehydratase [Myxococcales bacterium]|nr:2-hydroxyacyl-CoA dehydratase [Myxococcales bacterium]
MNTCAASAIGYACAYTPLPLLDAFGFAAHRLLPIGDWPDQAGQLLHENLCPHVKRLLDRGLAGDLPPLAGMVFMASCDAMRRLADAWKKARPDDRIVLVDLPVAADEHSIAFLAAELRRLAETLAEWSGRSFDPAELKRGIASYNELAALAETLRAGLRAGTLAGGAARNQALLRLAMTRPRDEALTAFRQAAAEAPAQETAAGAVPVLLFGNVLPDPEALTLFESCGARVIADDVCTGGRAFHRIEPGDFADDLHWLARALLTRPACARTMDPARPGKIAPDLVRAARECGARGVIGHVLKFCDPYLARLPAIREALREAGLPLLLLEGDCTLGAIGQQRTRIEAFVEMLG